MTVHLISSSSVALYLTPADLVARGLTPEGLTRELALTLTRAAFSEAGMPADGPLEIEAYPDPCGVLVFARLRESGNAWFILDDFERLLAAARSFATPPPAATLVLYEERYWLCVSAEDTGAVCRLSEFGTRVSAPFLDARVAEHGLMLLPEAAVSALLRYFRT